MREKNESLGVNSNLNPKIRLGEKITAHEAEFLAVEQALKAEGFTSPNPPVGCVIVDKDHKLISLGHTQKAGCDHAEIYALNQLGDKALLKNASVYVSLEPCSHEGRTGSCAKVLSELPIGSVIYGAKDPNPLVDGRGLQMLTAAQKKITRFETSEKQIRRLLEVFRVNVLEKRCFVAAKVATSMDGSISLNSGESQWITGEKSRDFVQELRGRYDAIAVGRKTIEQDNPKLNLRCEKYKNKEGKIVIIDPNQKVLSCLKKYKLSEFHEKENILGISKKKPKEPSQFTFVDARSESDLDLGSILESLYKDFKICSLFLEGGAYTISQFLKNSYCDRFYQFVAPCVLGADSKRFSEDIVLKNLSSRIQFDLDSFEKFGADLLLSYRKK